MWKIIGMLEMCVNFHSKHSENKLCSLQQQ